jgi:hypothetical protein
LAAISFVVIHKVSPAIVENLRISPPPLWSTLPSIGLLALAALFWSVLDYTDTRPSLEDDALM